MGSSLSPPPWRVSCLPFLWETDHDNLTERKYRWMGPSLATTIAPLVCLIERHLYEGTISFIPVVRRLRPPLPPLLLERIQPSHLDIEFRER